MSEITDRMTEAKRGTWRRVVEEAIGDLQGIADATKDPTWVGAQSNVLQLIHRLKRELHALTATKVFMIDTAGKHGVSYFLVQAADEQRARAMLSEEEPDELIITVQDLFVDVQLEKIAYSMTLYGRDPSVIGKTER